MSWSDCIDSHGKGSQWHEGDVVDLASMTGSPGIQDSVGISTEWCKWDGHYGRTCSGAKSGSRLCVVMTNNTHELSMGEVLEICEQDSIKLHTTIPSHPASNGVAELEYSPMQCTQGPWHEQEQSLGKRQDGCP